MIKILYLFVFILVVVASLNAQKPVSNKPSYYTHELTAKIIKVDTVLLVSNDYARTSAIPYDNFKVRCVRIKILSKINGDFKRAPDVIFIDLKENEHNCLYNFKEGQTYKIYAYISKYTSGAIRKKYRKKFFTLDCYNLPLVQEN